MPQTKAFSLAPCWTRLMPASALAADCYMMLLAPFGSMAAEALISIQLVQ